MPNNNIKSVIHAKDTDIAVISAVGKEDYISLTDIARYKEFICVNGNGERLKLDYITHKFNKLLQQNELRHIRFHDIRHSALSLLSQYHSMKLVQGYARHANFNITADTYCHFNSNDTLMELDTICTALNFGE